MAQSLDQQANRMPTPGFAVRSKDRTVSPLPPQGSDWSPWNVPTPPQSQPYKPNDLANAFNNLSFTNYASPIEATHPSNPSLTAPLPTVQTLTAAIPTIQNPSFDIVRKFVWCRDTLFLVDRLNQMSPNSSEIPAGPIHIEDPQLLQLIEIAIPIILSISSPQPMPNPIPGYVAEAIYLRATLAASGAWPEHIVLNPRAAFRDFEQAAKGGYPPAWFRLGRDYEAVGDEKHARTCFERGVKHDVESCLYVCISALQVIFSVLNIHQKRMGMAHLMGQLGLPPRPDVALPLLERAATLATVHVAQPAYVFGLLLLNEFSHVSIPPHFLSLVVPPGSIPAAEARKHLERAAYLHFTPAQYKLGHAYEFAEPPFSFDPLASVQYYSLASQQGEIEADMALSKWFLCGAEGAFEKDESLAFTFAEKAARKGLPSAEFALGYYAEVGVGGPKDIEAARKWYNRVGFAFIKSAMIFIVPC
jgi:TPR repeat protein